MHVRYCGSPEPGHPRHPGHAGHPQVGEAGGQGAEHVNRSHFGLEVVAVRGLGHDCWSEGCAGAGVAAARSGGDIG